MDHTENDINRVELLKSAIHEVRSPLAGIYDLTEAILAAKSPGLNKQTMADFTEIHSSTQHILSVVDSLVALMMVEIADRRCVNMDIALPIKEAVRRAKETLDSRGQLVRVSIAAGLPPVVIDPDYIVQVTFMLLSHVSRFAPEHGEIALSVNLKDAFITVSIGLSQPSELAASKRAIRIPAQYVKGVLGLELLTVDRVMAQHDGKFWVSKDADESLRYHYRLPISLAGNQMNRKSMKILLIEDNQGNADIYIRMLAQNGYKDVVHKLSGVEGLLAARQEPHGLILIDFDLPDIHGLQVGLSLATLMQKQRIKTVPLVALTAQSDVASQTVAERFGFDGFVGKPCLEDDLIDVICQLTATN